MKSVIQGFRLLAKDFAYWRVDVAGEKFAKTDADIVGMSTVPECLAARHYGLKVAALSVVTNLAAGISKTPLFHHETLAAAAAAYAQVERLLLKFISKLR